ncbi:MAG: ATP-dependent zinc metalloprotease FtsH [Candidatus Moranbacteria bacterium GW2011_GWC2_37_8]|nr:MAG: ATP-dependent zinc metalloprotease FtsH [Candidatus Moranbacteria bacterium GW2011_GWC2_37_8]KKQ62295.1 MAG: ATP-dependent zinc metalloprotease FtsH [Parcubacteria group bacterium GW2011_GWC1_38_22]KKQ80484.1 MAG: ATP-dependent zinc metalloprotease FtsH [Candidatus Moranbacteria bacterium GW2011_GWD2_38_7]
MKMEKLLKNIGFIVLFFLLASTIMILYTGPAQKPAEISLSELVTQINDGKVKEITVNGNDLAIILNDEAKEVSVKEPQSALTDSLSNYGVDKAKLQGVKIDIKQEAGFSSFAKNILLPFLLPFLIIGGFIWFMLRQAQRGNSQALSFGLSKARMTDPKDKNKRTTFADVAGAKEAKEELGEIVEFLKHPKKFIAIGAKIPKGVLLLGSPGTGKTLMAKAVAGEAGVPFFNISGSEFVEMFVGVGASRVRDLFKQAKKSAPAIVFIDEIDAVGRHRGAGLGGGHDEREQTLNQILVEMDGFEGTTSVIVIAATNRPDVLDPALLRPGRFDRRVVMDLPDINEREEILKIHMKNKPIEAAVNVRTLAERTSGFSGADLANLVNEAAILSVRRAKKTITEDELKESIEKVILGPERRSKAINKKEKEIIAYHEAGHALIGALLPNADPIQKVSIIARGQAGGYTLSAPTEDKSLHSRAYFIDELATLLGGHVSEQMFIGDVTTGPSNDLQRATHMARAMVTRYGMSPLGPRTFGKKEEMIFLGREINEERDYSDKTADAIDTEVSNYISEAYKTAEKILTENKAILQKIVDELLEKETIERDEFNAIVGIEIPLKKEEIAA